VIGLVAGVAFARVLSSFLFQIGLLEPFTMIAVAVLLTAVALTACYIPARRATRVNPTVALRYE
jgi:ABC-type antimicrobial peptide transport system permease subunit